eukprot:31074-Pelagococcus_subviridis.AAC.12
MPQYALAVALGGHHDTRTSSLPPAGTETRSGSIKNPSSRGIPTNDASARDGVSFDILSGSVLTLPTAASSNRSNGTSSGRPRRRSVGATSRPSAGRVARDVETNADDDDDDDDADDAFDGGR